MKINLVVPFADIQKAKKKGAQWNAQTKTWFVENVENIFDFMEWAPERLKRATTSGPLKHPPFVVTQPRSTRLKSKKRR